MRPAPTVGGPATGAAARIHGLDVLRGVAILLVMLRHAFPETFGGAGIVGVVLFFTLSGYLITGVIDREVVRTGRLSFWRFYRNRFLRLAPALLAMLAAWALITATVDPLHDRAHAKSSLLQALTYTADLPLPLPSIAPSLSPLWTLAVEEQFYVVWPLLLVLALRMGRARLLSIGLTVLGWLACLATVSTTHNLGADAYKLPQSWVAALLLGAAAALHRPLLARFRGPALPVAACVAGLVLAALSFLPDAKDLPAMYLVGGPLIALCTIVLVRSAEDWRLGDRSPLQLLRGLGTVSYATYLWNFLVLHLVRGHRPDLSPARGVAVILLTIAVAAASWFLIERPMARWRGTLDERRRAASGRAPAALPSSA